LEFFEKWLKIHDYVIVNKKDVNPKEEIRTIPSSKEEAIALYGYNPKTKKYPWDKGVKNEK
jgi:hypothetical protein